MNPTINPQLTRLQRSGIRAYTNLAREVDGCVMLTIGEPDLATPEPIKAAAAAALAADQTHYAPNQGLLSLRQAIARKETARGLRCTQEQVLITAGATGALFTALLGILEPGDEVIVPMPAFPLYESILTMAGAVLIPLETKKDAFQITEETLSAVLTEKTKAILLNSPNNPTGTVYNRASLSAVKQAVQAHDLWLICDNVYGQLTLGDYPDLSLDESLRDRTILCQSFSKPYAMTGWRVGYLVAEKALVERLLLLNAAQVASVPTFVQMAAEAALEVDTAPVAALYARRLAYACRRLREMGLNVCQSDGAFYVFPDISDFGLSSHEFCTRMIREAKVATVPGSCFGCEGFLRISCACADDQLRLGLDRMETFLATLKGETQ